MPSIEVWVRLKRPQLNAMAQLNNAIALQRSVLEIEHERRVTGHLPPSANCIDFWGAPIPVKGKYGEPSHWDV